IFFFFQAEDGIRDYKVTGVQTCALPIYPETAVVAQGERVALHRAIDELPPEFREVIVLRELEELSYKEIAEVAGVPVGTVMSRLSRARRRLEEVLCAQTEDC